MIPILVMPSTFKKTGQLCSTNLSETWSVVLYQLVNHPLYQLVNHPDEKKFLSALKYKPTNAKNVTFPLSLFGVECDKVYTV